MRRIILFFLLIFLNKSCKEQVQTSAGETIQLSNDEILAHLADAYIFGYPLLLMDLTKKASTNISSPHPLLPIAPINQIGHYRRFPDHTARTVVKPNRDTYYSIAWLDLNEEPMVLDMPPTDRYHVMQFMDAYTNVFLSIGPRTTGNQGGKFAVAGPKWKGDVPEGITLLKAPTNMVWMLGRIHTYDDVDGSTFVKELQDQISMHPLSQWDKPREKMPPLLDSTWLRGTPPIEQLELMDTKDALNRIAVLLKENPPARMDFPIVQKMKNIGLEPGNEFDLEKANLLLDYKIKQIPKVVAKRLRERRSNPPKELLVNNWSFATKGIGKYDTSYLRRTYISFIGLGANLPEDAVYPNTNFDSNGNLLEGSNSYRIHMDVDEIPPAKAFWSVTLYDGDEFLIENEWNRYNLSDKSNLKYNPDGSLDLYFQSEAPKEEYYSNWLPTPKDGPFSITMRLYWPEQQLLNQEWTPPLVELFEDSL